MVGIAKSFGILLGQFVEYFDIPVALAALVMGVAGGMYTLAGMIYVYFSLIMKHLLSFLSGQHTKLCWCH